MNQMRAWDTCSSIHGYTFSFAYTLSLAEPGSVRQWAAPNFVASCLWYLIFNRYPDIYCTPWALQPKRRKIFHSWLGSICWLDNLTGIVKHGYRVSKPPLRPRVMVQLWMVLWCVATSPTMGNGTIMNGSVVCGHCTCMAGLAETCPHDGAVILDWDVLGIAIPNLNWTQHFDSQYTSDHTLEHLMTSGLWLVYTSDDVTIHRFDLKYWRRCEKLKQGG